MSGLSIPSTCSVDLIRLTHHRLDSRPAAIHPCTGVPSLTSSVARWLLMTYLTSLRRASSPRVARAAWSRRLVQSSWGGRAIVVRSQILLARGASPRYQRRRGNICTLLASPRARPTRSASSGRRRMRATHAHPASTEGRPSGRRLAGRRRRCCTPLGRAQGRLGRRMHRRWGAGCTGRREPKAALQDEEIHRSRDGDSYDAMAVDDDAYTSVRMQTRRCLGVC